MPIFTAHVGIYQKVSRLSRAQRNPIKNRSSSHKRKITESGPKAFEADQ